MTSLIEYTSAEAWSQYYDTLKSKVKGCEGSPHFEETQKFEDKLYIRKPIFNITSAEIPSSKSFVFCDVAVFSSEAVIDLSAHAGCYLVLCARTLVTKDSCAIRVKITPNCSAKFILWISGTSHPLTVSFFVDEDSIVSEHCLCPTDNVIMVKLTYTGQEVVPEEVSLRTVLNNKLAVPFINFQLRAATLALHSHPQLSTVILEFVRPLITERFHPHPSDASPLLNQIDRHAVGGVVPLLSVTELASLAKRSLDAALSFRQDYERFVAKEDPTESIDAARSLALQTKALISEQTAMTEEAEAFWHNAELTRRIAYSNAVTQRRDVQLQGITFTASSQEWAAKKCNKIKAQAIIECFGVVGSVAAVGIGNVGGITNIPTLISDILSAGDRLTRLQESVTQLGDLSTVVAGFQEVYEAMAVLNFEVIEGDATDEQSKVFLERKGNPDPERRNAITNWRTSVMGISSYLERAVSDGVPSAEKYLAAIKKQVEAEQNYCQTYMALSKACRDYAQAKLRLHTLESSFREQQLTVERLEREKTTFDEKDASFFDRFLAMRSDIVDRVKQYQDSHRYCTLRLVPLDLDVAKPTAHLQMCYDSITDDRISFLKSHTTPPASFTKHATLADLGLDSQAVTTGLQSEERQFTFLLNDNALGPFKDLYNVYLCSMEVWLEGIRSKNSQASVILRVQTNGIYQNVDAEGCWLTFTTKPMDDASFAYTLRGSVAGQPEMLLEFGDPFIRPTPFTQWVITLSNPSELDLSDLCSVRFQWKGSAYTSKIFKGGQV